MKLFCATANRHKLGEIRAILEELGGEWELLSLADFPDLVLPVENGADYAENALLKARAGFRWTDLPCFADDSGLEVDALGGAPGLHSQRYAEDDPSRRHKLLEALAGLPEQCRRARFVCHIALVGADCSQLFQGEARGCILEEERGSGGFGYDPLFCPDGEKRTFAEIPPEEKNRISHRSQALRRMGAWLLGA